MYVWSWKKVEDPLSLLMCVLRLIILLSLSFCLPYDTYSVIADSVIESLRDLAVKGVIVMATVHSPSSDAVSD